MATSLQHDRTFGEAARLLHGAFQLDHSTSVSELGSVFQWQGDKPLQQLKRNLADAYGAAWAFPSTHGTTILNILALLTACPAGGRVLMNRDAHGSVTAALIHGGFHPTYLVPRFDAGLGLSLAPTVDEVAAALDRTPVDCVFLTSPNYFGIVGERRGDRRGRACPRHSRGRRRRTRPALPFLRGAAGGCRGTSAPTASRSRRTRWRRRCRKAACCCSPTMRWSTHSTSMSTISGSSAARSRIRFSRRSSSASASWPRTAPRSGSGRSSVPRCSARRRGRCRASAASAPSRRAAPG